MKDHNEDLLSYINELNKQSFEGWNLDEIKGYKTALISISEFCKTRTYFSREEILQILEKYQYLDTNPCSYPWPVIKVEDIKNILYQKKSGKKSNKNLIDLPETEFEGYFYTMTTKY